METPTTFSAPIASQAIAATRVESMPAGEPRITDSNPFLRT
jgi:hypothetical protein